jgi:hypothetical protein
MRWPVEEEVEEEEEGDGGRGGGGLDQTLVPPLPSTL